MHKFSKGDGYNSAETVRKAIAFLDCSAEDFFKKATEHSKKKGADPVRDAASFVRGGMEPPCYVVQYADYLAVKNLAVLAAPASSGSALVPV